jgi:mono/diheme cytochrome c family protein
MSLTDAKEPMSECSGRKQIYLFFAFAWVGVAAMLGGCKAMPPPGKLDTAVITRAKHWLTVRNKDAKNPLAATSEHVADGKDSFSHYCVACHGLDGQNTGVPFAASMSPPVPSLASATVQSYTDGQLKFVIDNGIFPSGMPASKGVLTEEEIWSVVLYIRHLPPAGSLGEPAMYSGVMGDREDGGPDSKSGDRNREAHNREAHNR